MYDVIKVAAKILKCTSFEVFQKYTEETGNATGVFIAKYHETKEIPPAVEDWCLDIIYPANCPVQSTE